MRELARLPLDGTPFAAKYGPWAVIAGASEGTGSCYAEELAAMGLNLVLVSRRQDALCALGDRLKAEYGIEYRAVSQDLTAIDAGASLLAATADFDIGLYISNAGADGAGNSFLDTETERSHRLVRMNIGTLIETTHGFGNRFRARGAGLGGQPMLAMYAGTKAFEICFAESLWGELGDANIDVIAIAAPLMNTPTLQRATEGMGFDLSISYDPADVTHNALASLFAGKPVLIVPDGPGEENLPAVEAARIERATAFKQWAKAYTG